MNIAIIGNGKMGKIISKIAEERGHVITVRSSSKNPISNFDLKDVDVAIDFSTPDTAFMNISHVIKKKIPVVSGTTGWTNKLNEIKKLCKHKKSAFLYAPNFSIGVNLFFKLNTYLAKLIKGHGYDLNIKEIHHTEKLDSPSGTAKKIKEDINKIISYTNNINAERIKEVVGIHRVIYNSDYDEIEIKHSAKNRVGFAVGAIIAAEWIINKEGIFNMGDVLNGLIYD